MVKAPAGHHHHHLSEEGRCGNWRLSTYDHASHEEMIWGIRENVQLGGIPEHSLLIIISIIFSEAVQYEVIAMNVYYMFGNEDLRPGRHRESIKGRKHWPNLK